MQLLEELLVVDASHPADLRHLDLGGRVAVNKVGRDADGQLASKLFPPEAYRGDDWLISQSNHIQPLCTCLRAGLNTEN